MQTLSYGQEPPTSEGIVLQDTYRLIRQIGFGGMGVVYEAIHTRLPARFAVKVLLRSLMANAEAFARFCREAEIMSELRHPHVVQIVDFNLASEQQPYFVMEYLEGRDLEAHLASDGPLELRQVTEIVDAIASALAAAHRRGIIHRDLKPSNIFLCTVDGQADPFVKVLDFGVSKVRSASRVTLGSRSKLVGTPHYMSPEQAQGRIDEIDGRTDQFALAAIAYEMLTGQDAFVGEDPVSLLYQIVHHEPAPLSRHLAGASAGVQAVLTRGLAKDPALRFPSITEFSAALAEAARPAPSITLTAIARPAAPPHPPHPPDEASVEIAGEIEVASPPASATEGKRERKDLVTGKREITLTLDRVPRSPYRAIVLTLVFTLMGGGLAASAVSNGWARTIPDDAASAFRSLMARVQHLPPRSQAESESDPGPREAEPPTLTPLPPELTPLDRRAGGSALSPPTTTTTTTTTTTPASPGPPSE